MKIRVGQSPKPAMYKRVPNRDRDPRGHFPSTKTGTLFPYWCELDRAALLIAEVDSTVAHFERCDECFAVINENGDRFEFEPFLTLVKADGRRGMLFCGNAALAVNFDPAVKRSVDAILRKRQFDIESVTNKSVTESPALDNANLIDRYRRTRLTADMLDEIWEAFGNLTSMPLFLLERALGERLAGSSTICTGVASGLLHFDINEPLEADTPFSLVKKEFGHA